MRKSVARFLFSQNKVLKVINSVFCLFLKERGFFAFKLASTFAFCYLTKGAN